MEFIEATPKENINLISNYVTLTFYKGANGSEPQCASTTRGVGITEVSVEPPIVLQLKYFYSYVFSSCWHFPKFSCLSIPKCRDL